MTDTNKFRPVTFDPSGYSSKRRKKDAKFAIAYDELEDEFAALAALLKARADAGLTQAEVATRMGVTDRHIGSNLRSPYRIQ